LDLGGTGNPAHLFGAPDTDDRTGHRWIPQGPGNGNLSRCCVITVADSAKRLDQPQITGEQRLLEIRADLPPIVFRMDAIRSRVIAPLSIPEAMGE
jgi:hypothetical protein